MPVGLLGNNKRCKGERDKLAVTSTKTRSHERTLRTNHGETTT